MLRHDPDLGTGKERAYFWTRADLAGLELLWGRFQRHSYRPHSHAGYVIAVVTAGIEEVNCRGALHRAGPGDILFVNPEEIHDGARGTDGGWQYRVFYPTIEAMRALSAEDGTPQVMPRFKDTVVHNLGLARRLADLHAAAEDPDDTLGIDATWAELLSELIARYATRSQPTQRGRLETSRIQRTRELIEAEFDRPLSLERLAQEAGLSSFHLLRLFKAEMGLAPHAYLIALRLRRAKALLDQGVGAAEAATTVGFVDQSHFIKHFKSAYSFTPGQYLAAHSDLA